MPSAYTLFNNMLYIMPKKNQKAGLPRSCFTFSLRRSESRMAATLSIFGGFSLFTKAVDTDCRGLYRDSAM